jgi:hypothetical protein
LNSMKFAWQAKKQATAYPRRMVAHQSYLLRRGMQLEYAY